jgi:hypothetical protein
MQDPLAEGYGCRPSAATVLVETRQIRASHGQKRYAPGIVKTMSRAIFGFASPVKGRHSVTLHFGYERNADVRALRSATFRHFR